MTHPAFEASWIQRPHRHHLLPQESIDYFQERGFPGRGIDRWCVELEAGDHEIVHGGNQALARREWKTQEWNTALMERLESAESRLQRRLGPDAKLSRSQILKIVEQQRVKFRISNLPYIDYSAK